MNAYLDGQPAYPHLRWRCYLVTKAKRTVKERPVEGADVIVEAGDDKAAELAQAMLFGLQLRHATENTAKRKAQPPLLEHESIPQRVAVSHAGQPVDEDNDETMGRALAELGLDENGREV